MLTLQHDPLLDVQLYSAWPTKKRGKQQATKINLAHASSYSTKVSKELGKQQASERIQFSPDTQDTGKPHSCVVLYAYATRRGEFRLAVTVLCVYRCTTPRPARSEASSRQQSTSPLRQAHRTLGSRSLQCMVAHLRNSSAGSLRSTSWITRSRPACDLLHR